MSVVDDIKARLDIVSYIQRTVPLKKAGRTYKAPCPFHAEKTPSFVVDPDRQSWRCFGACATGGDIFSFVMRQNGWTFAEALTELAKMAGVELKPRTPEQQQSDAQTERWRGALQAAADYFHECLFDPNYPAGAAALAYARGRRSLTDETLKRFQIGYAPDDWQAAHTHLARIGYSEADLLAVGLLKRSETERVYDAFRNRLMIPIRDERGRVVGFGARALNPDDNPKYLNSAQSPVFDKGRTLFAFDLAARAIRESGTAVIVEGYLDAIQAHQAGYHNVVAQMGTALTDSQLRALAPRWAKKIVLALDSDAAGQRATRRSLEVARDALRSDYTGRLQIDIRVLTIPDAKDPDDLIREDAAAWGALVEAAVPVADFVIDFETQELPPNASVQEREAVARSLLPILTVTEDNLLRQDNIQKLARRLRFSERDLLAWAQAEQQAVKVKPVPAPPHLNAPLEMSSVPAVPAASPQHANSVAEKRCLRILFKHPEMVYDLKRHFRELAGNDPQLAEGPLCAFGSDDFTDARYRALMMMFEEAMRQDEQDALTYMRSLPDAELVAELERVLADEWDELPQKADMQPSIRQTERLVAPVDWHAALLCEALALRDRRIRMELAAQQQEQELLRGGGDEVAVITQVMILRRAKHRIDAELQRQKRALRR